MSESKPVDAQDAESTVDADEVDAVVRDAMSDTQKMSVDEIAAAVHDLEKSEVVDAGDAVKAANTPVGPDEVKPEP